MPVVALKDFRQAEPATKLTTVFCVQAYWRDRAKLVRGKFQQFSSMESALRAGKTAGTRAPRVEVFRWRGIAESDYCAERTVLAIFGEKPET